MPTAPPHDGSKEAPKGVLKIEPEQKTSTVRRITSVNSWFVPNKDLTDTVQTFTCGLMLDVIFNPRAEVMGDVFCRTGHISEADATGVLIEEENPQMPVDAVRTAEVGYDTKVKVFHVKGDPTEVFTSADYLLLNYDGSSMVGWKR